VLFLLTEQGAGVLSGLIVQTTATFRHGKFIIDSPTPIKDSKKFWISQGLTAKWGVVIARLLLPAKNGDTEDKGPHAFIVDLEAQGVHKEDMERKVDFNYLDNACLWFNGVEVPLDGLLRGLSRVDENGIYHLTDPDVPYDFVNTVALNLMVGRVGIAGGSISKLKGLISNLETYTCGREIPVGKDTTKALNDMPFFRDVILETKAILRVFTEFSLKLERDFVTAPIVTEDLVHRIACAKIEITNFCIDSIQRIKKTVGSYSLMEKSPFGSQTDTLFVFAFAEGDVAILQQKMTRDLLKKLNLFGLAKTALSLPYTLLKNQKGVGIQETMLKLDMVKLGLTMADAKRKSHRENPSLLINAWLDSHSLVNKIARRKSLLTILDDVSELEGTYEYEIFKRYVVNQA